MAGIEVKRLVTGAIRTNCYIAYDSDTKEGIIIDPADEFNKIKNEIIRLSIIPKAILLTHGHFDHIGAAMRLKEEFNLSIYAHEEERDILQTADLNLSSSFGNPFSIYGDIYVKENECLEIAGMKIFVIHTPGHTKGSCCYYIKEANILFSGDTLFYASHGRTDYPTGSERDIAYSIKGKLLKLDGSTIVYPGHEAETTIEDEKKWY